jgi:DNA polymerase-3 subunit delta
MLASMANLAPVTLIVGEEEFLVDRALREAVAQARTALAEASGSGEGDLHDLEASALGQGELAALTSPSLFGGGAVVVVRNAQNAGKEISAELTKYAKGPAPDAAVILTHAGGAKGKALVTELAKAGARQVDCPEADPAERADRLREERVPPRRAAGRRGRGPRPARRDRR